VKDGEFRFELESQRSPGWKSEGDPPGAGELLHEERGESRRYSLDAPFTLSGGIREITVESRRAIIVQ